MAYEDSGFPCKQFILLAKVRFPAKSLKGQHGGERTSVATVYKRNSTYWVRFQWKGKEVRRSAHTTSKATAQQFLGQLLDEHRRLDRGGRPRRTYKESLERFTHDYLPTLKPRTQERYRTSFRQLNAAFDGLYLDEITRTRLADYASDRMKAGVKGATVRRDLATLSCVCSCAVAWEYIDTNPVRQFSKRHIREVAATDNLSDRRAGRSTGRPCSCDGRSDHPVPCRDRNAPGGGLRPRMVAGVDPTARGQADQDQDLKPTGSATERCRHRHTDRHTQAHHVALRVLAW